MIASIAENEQGCLHGWSQSVWGLHVVEVERNLHKVPVRGNPKLKTSIGTLRLAPLGETLLAGMKSSGCRSRGVDMLMNLLTYLGVERYNCREQLSRQLEVVVVTTRGLELTLKGLRRFCGAV